MIAQALEIPGPGSDCPPESILLELAQGSIAGDVFESLLLHLDGCAACRRMVAELARDAVVAGESRGPKPGDSIDRFLLLDELGRGGMGVVYAAFDPTLDRKVALKLVRPDPLLPARTAAASLLAEAQALARLSHPNVVSVFEARAHGEQVFLVMELIAGRSLRELTESRPGQAVLLSRFCEAGRGLVAAHDAGLVHRDFKPDNALLGDDGRVCVTDFGLARHSSSARPARGEPAGTLGYIAPELWLGKPADARSDQFSFCVSVWEALFGARPFRAERGAALLEQVRRGPIFPLFSAVPLRVRRALVRGLRFDPQERHPSMRALLEPLQGDGQNNLPAPVLAALALALLGTGATAHAVWIDAHAAAAAAASTREAASLEAARAEAEAASAREENAGENFSRSSFAGEETDLAANTASADQLAAPDLRLAVAAPRRKPAGVCAQTCRAPHNRATSAKRALRAKPGAEMAEMSRDGRRDDGDGGTSSGGGSSMGSLNDIKGASTLAPLVDPSLSTRTLR